MTTWIRVTCVSLLAWGCGGGDGEGNGNGNGNGDRDGGRDGATTDAPQDAPGLEPDSGPPPCYECDTGAQLCLPSQQATAECAYGDLRPGDVCEAGVSACLCLTFGGGDIGMCTETCANNGDCLGYNALCVNFGGADSYCVWPCTDDSECPPGEFPFPDFGPLDGPADMGAPPEPPPDTGPLPDGAEPVPDMPPPPDAGAPSCYASCDPVGGASGLVCRADQAQGAGCVYGDFRAGDTCEAGVSPCDCITIGTDDFGFCTEVCVAPGDCSFPGDCVDFGATDFCMYTCTNPSDCPP